MKLELALIDCRRFPDFKEGEERPPAELVYTAASDCCGGAAARLYPQVPVVVLQTLCDFQYGAFSEKSAEELESDEQFQSWSTADITQPCPQGESPYQFATRCTQAMRAIADEMSGKGIACVALIAHETVIATILRRYCIPRSLYRDWRTSPGKGYLIEYDTELCTAKVRNVI